MGAEKPSLAVRTLRRLATLVMTQPAWVVLPQVVLFGLALWFTLTHLEFDMDRNSLVDSNLQYHRNFLDLKKQFPGKMISSPSRNPKTSRRTASSSNASPPALKHIQPTGTRQTFSPTSSTRAT